MQSNRITIVVASIVALVLLLALPSTAQEDRMSVFPQWINQFALSLTSSVAIALMFLSSGITVAGSEDALEPLTKLRNSLVVVLVWT